MSDKFNLNCNRCGNINVDIDMYEHNEDIKIDGISFKQARFFIVCQQCGAMESKISTLVPCKDIEE